MALIVKHKFVNLIPDDPEDAAAGATLPSHWNDEHIIVGEIEGNVGVSVDGGNATTSYTEPALRIDFGKST